MSINSQLNYSNLSIYEINEIYFLHFDNISKINLSYNNLQKIANNTFQHNKNLRILLLNNNKLSDLGSCLDPLINLEVLNLNNNKLDQVPKNLFRLTRKLIELELKSNLLKNLKTKSFFYLKNLLSLNLSDNEIKYIKSSLKPLINLKTLKFNNNLIQFISYGQFKKNICLENLCFCNNPLTEIYRKSFRNLVKLKKLCLFNVKLKTTVDKQILKANRNLQILNLSSSQITLIDQLFNNLFNLLILDLSYNNITEADICNAFNNLAYLKDLNLCSNFIRKLNGDFLKENVLLENLNLRYNRYLKELTIDFFRSLINLKSLYIEGCNLNCVLDFKIFQFNNKLENLSFDYVYEIKGSLPSCLKSLKYFGDFFDDYVPEFICNFSCENLEALRISMIHKGTISVQNFNNLLNLKYLNLSFNNIRDLHPMIFSNLTVLMELILDYNNIESLRNPIFGPHNNLMILSLKLCSIRKVHSTFFKFLSKLNVLILSSNLIRVLKENVFCHLVNLKELRIDRCLLIELPVKIFQFNKKLHKIRLNYNDFNRVPVECFNNLNRLKFVLYDTDLNLPDNLENLNCELIAV